MCIHSESKFSVEDIIRSDRSKWVLSRGLKEFTDLQGLIFTGSLFHPTASAILNTLSAQDNKFVYL